MNLAPDILQYIDASVLCWLATSSLDGQPNVSPKEIFTYHAQHLLIANIMSPRSVKNIKSNPKICVSLIDVLVQKGYQLKGTAEVINKNHADFVELHKILFALAGRDFPINSIFKIKVQSAKQILAPRYVLFPETTEEQQIASAKNQYQQNY